MCKVVAFCETGKRDTDAAVALRSQVWPGWLGGRGSDCEKNAMARRHTGLRTEQGRRRARIGWWRVLETVPLLFEESR